MSTLSEEALAAQRILAAAGHGPIDLDALLAAGATLLRAGDARHALDAARAALATAPEDARGWSLAGHAAYALGQRNEAAEALARAISLDDDDLASAISLAELRAQEGQADEALSLTDYVLMREREAPALRQRAAALFRALTGRAPSERPA